MRFRIVLLLVAALLLKGWAGEAMAGRMLAQQLQQPAVAEVVHTADCHGHAVQDEGTPHDASCEQCQACSLHALPAMPVVLASERPQAVPAATATRFASAEPRQGRKPPVA